MRERDRDSKVRGGRHANGCEAGCGGGSLERERAFRGPPQLVVEGCGIGTVVIRDARAEVFGTARRVARERRRRQLA